MDIEIFWKIRLRAPPTALRWAAEGACSDNSSYMLKLCPVACGVCDLECKARRLTPHTCRRQPD